MVQYRRMMNEVELGELTELGHAIVQTRSDMLKAPEEDRTWGDYLATLEANLDAVFS